MNEKFTPGNWQADFETGNIYPRDPKETGYGHAVGMVTCVIDKEEYEANMRLIAHAKRLYFALLKARVFVLSEELCTEIENLLREINPDYDKYPEVTDIKEFAERVKNMRNWQKERANNPNTNTEYYAAGNEQLVDSIVAEILEVSPNKQGYSKCPSCGQNTLIHEDGCMHCRSCGWSACG